MQKKEIIKRIEEYNLQIDDTHKKDNEDYFLICEFVNVNDFCFRKVRKIGFCGNTMWIDDHTSINTENVEKFSIIMHSINFCAEDLKIIKK